MSNERSDRSADATRFVRSLGRVDLLVLAAIAYLPPLRSAPGRMPADTKLFLYLDPGRLISDSIWMWEPRQFGGWVPHQMVGYLWPAGPWFWTFDKLGVSDWIAHRLWIGTLLFAASAGMRWCARQLGFRPSAATVAALAYGLSPFLLAYVGRTSGLLLPWAGLGWMLGIMVRATRTDKARWREPAQLALVLACLGGLNATAIILIAPPLLLWLLDAVLRGTISIRRCLTTVAQVTLLSLGTALWWLIGLVFQGTYGANVLAYTETLDSVTFTATGSEVLRGAGYWLFYVTERDGPLTIAADRYQTSWLTIGISFLVPALAILGLLITRTPVRRFAGWCLLAGVVIAVGVHPIDSPSPLMSAIANHPTSSWALAFRSSTRAVPVILIALALGLGSMSAVLTARLQTTRLPSQLGPVGLAALAIVNLPALWQGHLVNPVQSRTQDVPAAWLEVAADLDSGIADGGRVLQLPGTEFGVHRWGNLVDPLLPGITDRPIITRDLAPLGSAAAMDLLYALDDRVQDGTLEPAALAPIARLLGADQVLLVGDVAYERYRTRHPVRVGELLAGAPDVDEERTYGEPVLNAATSVFDGTDVVGHSESVPLSPVSTARVEDAVPIVRVKDREVVVVGSGMGLVDAAAAAVIDGTELIRYSADLIEDQGSLDEAGAASAVVLTDTNRKQAHQWRGSREVLGMTEDVDAAVLAVDLADHRLPVFPDLPAERMTTAVQVGSVHAIASAYGSPTTYRPEDRAVFAIDGDPDTAWRVADRGEPVGERIRFSVADGSNIQKLSVLQEQSAGATRWITQVSVITDDGAEMTVALDDSSRSAPGQTIELPSPASRWVEIEITAASTGRRDLYADFGPVGFAEVTLDDRESTRETVRLPSDTAALTADADDVTAVFTRWRAEPTDPVRRDPEPELVREWSMGSTGEYSLAGTLRLGARVSDVKYAELFGFQSVPNASASLPGAPRSAAWAAFDGDPTTGWVSVPGDPLPAIGIALPSDVTISAVELDLDVAQHRNLPTTATIIGDRGPVTTEMSIGPTGLLRLSFEQMTTRSIRVQFSDTSAFELRDIRTGEAVRLPIGVREFRFDGHTPVVPSSLPEGCRSDLATLNGEPIAVRLNPTLDELLDRDPIPLSLCEGGVIPLIEGVNRLHGSGATNTGFDIDQVVLRSADASPAGGGLPEVRVLDQSRVSRAVEVGGCPLGCWLVHGEGWSSGWQATLADGTDLGPSQVVDGGFNGWWMEPFTAPTTVNIRWAPQSAMWPPLGLSVLAIALCCWLARPSGFGRRVAADPDGVVQFARPAALGVRSAHESVRPGVWQSIAALLLAGIVVQPAWALASAAVVAVAWLVRRRMLIAWAGLGLVTAIAALYIRRELVTNPFPGYGWIVNIDELHRPTMLAVVLLAVGLSVSDEPLATGPEAPSESPATSTHE